MKLKNSKLVLWGMLLSVTLVACGKNNQNSASTAVNSQQIQGSWQADNLGVQIDPMTFTYNDGNGATSCNYTRTYTLKGNTITLPAMPSYNCPAITFTVKSVSAQSMVLSSSMYGDVTLTKIDPNQYSYY